MNRVERRHRFRWRLTGLAAGLALVAMLLPIPAPIPITEAHSCTPDAEIGVGGRLILPGGSGISTIDLPSREARTVPVLPSQGLATSVASSMDGGQLAVTRFWRPPDQRVGGQDILIVRPDGGEPIATIERARPGEALGAPAWLPDGSLVFERRELSGATEAVQVERARPGGSAEVLAVGAAWPTASPDGNLLVMTRPSDRGDLLVAMPMTGGPERVLVDTARRLSIAFPRFSADGAWIAFTAASDAPTGLMPVPGQASSSVATNQRHDPLGFAPLGAGVALAHGIPWDVWVVRPDGSDLRRVTLFFDDDSSVAWSPDGRWLVTYSAEALHVIAFDGAANYCISNVGGYGGFEWRP